MSQERPSGNSGAEHHPEPSHPHLTDEATVAVPTPNHFWRMMTDPRFPSPASNPVSFVITGEAFLCLTSQVQALAGMVHTIVPYLPQLVHSTAPPAAPPQTESPAAPNRGVPLEVESPQPQVAEARATSSTPTPARLQSRSHNPIQTEPDFDTVSTDTADALREQVRRVHKRLDEVQKEVLKSRGECTPKTDHCLPPGDGPRERRTPLLVRGAVHIVAHQYMAAETLVAGKREEMKHPRGEQSRGHPVPPPKRREDREYIHDTKECRDLQYQIKDLIRQGHLRRYVREQSSVPDDRPPQDSSPWPKGPVEKQIDVIFSGPASGGNSSSAQKAYARSEVGKKPLHDERRWRYIQVGRRGASMP
ncbi:hypothetical protein BHE74_00038247 [Ensete ventricosum]|nr:hypothetical protein BHE74_00038247 [Ensete ventricosum]